MNIPVENNNRKRYVPWHVFWASAVVVIATFGAIYSIALSAIDRSQDNRVEIRATQENIKNIDANIVEIKRILERGMQ